MNMESLVPVEMMETQDHTLVENDIQDKMSLIVQAASMVSEDMVSQNMGLVQESSMLLEPKCLVCDFVLTSARRYDVNYAMLPKSQTLVINSLTKVLKSNNVALGKTRSSVLCEMCFNLFDDLEVSEEQAKLLRDTLLANFSKTCELYHQLVESTMSSVECQTDLLADDLILNIVKKEEPPVKASKRKSKKPAKKKQRTSARRKTRGKKYYESSEEDSMAEDREELPEEVPEDLPEDSAPNDSDHVVDYNSDNVKPDPDEVAVPTRPKRKRIRRIHPCEHCSRMFRSVAEVKNHILVKHLDRNPNHCLFCQKKLNSRNGLYMHLKMIHNISYSDRKELVFNQTSEGEQNDSEPIEESLLIEQQKILEEANNSDLSDVDIDDNDQVSNSEAAMDSDASKKKSTRSRSRSRRKEKENLGSRSNARSNSKVLKVTYLSEEGIGEEEFVVKEEQEEGGNEMEGEEKKPKPKRKRVRPPRIGERACMPLIHACPTCGKKWRTVSELNAHIQTHSDLRPFVCEICGQGYKMRKALDVHVGMHNGIHPFTCHFCNKSFTQKVGLQKHLPIHTGYSRYQCDLCGKRFIHQKSFAIHKMVHSGEKNIKCSICNMALLSSSHLKRHFRVHTGERPYECTVCYKRFAEKYNLNAHQKIHLPPGAVDKEGASNTSRKRSNRQKCQVCGFTSSRQCSLQDHWEREHKDLLLGEQYAHTAHSPTSSSERIHQVSTGIIPQMIIDPSGSITYEEKPHFAEQLIFPPPENTGLSVMP